jgi:hypothetical protein
MYLLNTFPTAHTIEPEPFVQGSRAELEDVTRKFCEEYNSDAGLDYAKEWVHFRDNDAPQNDSVDDWVRTHPLHVPFHDTLVRGAPVYVSDVPKDGMCAPPVARNRPRKSKPLDYVTWSRRGEDKDSKDPCLKFPNIVVEGLPGIERFSVPVHCRSSSNSDNTLSTSGCRLPPLATDSDVRVDAVHISNTCSAAATTGDVVKTDSGSEHSDEDDEYTDSDTDVNGWVTCRGTHDIPKYYCARDCVGNTFTVPKKFLTKAHFGDKCPRGKIHSIVRKVGAESNDVYFKFYNHVHFPEEPPSEDSDEYCYVRCVDFMSSSVNRRMMEWDKSYRESVQAKAPRKKRDFWAYENVGPALYDKEPDVDVNSGRKLRSTRLRRDASPSLNTIEDDEDREDCKSDPGDTSAAISAVALPPPSSSRSTRQSATSLPSMDVQNAQLRHNIRTKLVQKGILKHPAAYAYDHTLICTALLC